MIDEEQSSSSTKYETSFGNNQFKVPSSFCGYTSFWTTELQKSIPSPEVCSKTIGDNFMFDMFPILTKLLSHKSHPIQTMIMTQTSLSVPSILPRRNLMPVFQQRLKTRRLFTGTSVLQQERNFRNRSSEIHGRKIRRLCYTKQMLIYTPFPVVQCTNALHQCAKKS